MDNYVAVIKQWVKENNLKDSYQNVSFKCNVIITTPFNTFEGETTGRVIYDMYTEVVIYPKLDNYKYPTNYLTRNNHFKIHYDKLLVTGVHPNYGDFSVEISPLGYHNG